MNGESMATTSGDHSYPRENSVICADKSSVTPKNYKGRICTATGCSVYQSDGFHFFSFPSNTEQCKRWIDNCGAVHLRDKPIEDVKRKYSLCSKHFDVSQYTSPIDRARLKYMAVPTRFQSTLPTTAVKAERVSVKTNFMSETNSESKQDVSLIIPTTLGSRLPVIEPSSVKTIKHSIANTPPRTHAFLLIPAHLGNFLLKHFKVERDSLVSHDKVLEICRKRGFDPHMLDETVSRNLPNVYMDASQSYTPPLPVKKVGEIVKYWFNLSDVYSAEKVVPTVSSYSSDVNDDKSRLLASIREQKRKSDGSTSSVTATKKRCPITSKITVEIEDCLQNSRLRKFLQSRFRIKDRSYVHKSVIRKACVEAGFSVELSDAEISCAMNSAFNRFGSGPTVYTGIYGKTKDTWKNITEVIGDASQSGNDTEQPTISAALVNPQNSYGPSSGIELNTATEAHQLITDSGADDDDEWDGSLVPRLMEFIRDNFRVERDSFVDKSAIRKACIDAKFPAKLTDTEIAAAMYSAFNSSVYIFGLNKDRWHNLAKIRGEFIVPSKDIEFPKKVDDVTVISEESESSSNPSNLLVWQGEKKAYESTMDSKRDGTGDDGSLAPRLVKFIKDNFRVERNSFVEKSVIRKAFIDAKFPAKPTDTEIAAAMYSAFSQTVLIGQNKDRWQNLAKIHSESIVHSEDIDSPKKVSNVPVKSQKSESFSNPRNLLMKVTTEECLALAEIRQGSIKDGLKHLTKKDKIDGIGLVDALTGVMKTEMAEYCASDNMLNRTQPDDLAQFSFEALRKEMDKSIPTVIKLLDVLCEPRTKYSEKHHKKRQAAVTSVAAKCLTIHNNRMSAYRHLTTQMLTAAGTDPAALKITNELFDTMCAKSYRKLAGPSAESSELLAIPILEAEELSEDDFDSEEYNFDSEEDDFDSEEDISDSSTTLIC